MYFGLHENCPLFLIEFNEIQVFSTDFSKYLQISHFMKIQPVGVKSFHTPDVRTDTRRS